MSDEANAAAPPPSAPEAEVSLLSALMIDPDIVADVRPIVSDGDFFQERHRLVYRALLQLVDTGKSTDVVSLIDALRERNYLEQVGGIDYVSTLVDRVPVTSSAESHARIVRDRARLRRFIRACQASVEEALEAGAEPDAVLQAAEARILGATERRRGVGYRSVGDAVHDALVLIEDAARAKGGITGMRTSIPTLDRMLAGLEPGMLTVLAARPSMGKSALGWGIAEQAAADGHGVAIASYEMSNAQVLRRGLAKTSGIDSKKLRRGELDQPEWAQVAAAANTLTGLPIWIDDQPGHTIEAVRADLRRVQRDHPVRLLVVDYLQQLTGPGQNRNNEVEHISRGLKRIARELDVHVLALAQLSRAVEHRSDIVLLLWRPEYYFNQQTPQEARDRWGGKGELIVGKQRDGETGRIELLWDPARLTFYERDVRAEQLEMGGAA